MDREELKQDVLNTTRKPNASHFYKQAAKHFKTYGNLMNIYTYKNAQYNLDLQDYLEGLRVQYKEGTLDPELKKRYDRMGMVWENAKQKEWDFCYNLLAQYRDVYGSLIMPEKTEIQNVRIHDWLTEQREAYKKGELSLSREAKMQALDPKWAISKIANTPFTEKSVAYYVSKVFPDLQETFKPPCLKGKELDLYIPSLNIGIEYDGGRYHKIEDDLHKNDLCARSGIRLIRVRDKLCPHMDSDGNCTVINRVTNSRTDFNNTMHKLFDALGVEEHPDIDYARDKSAIESHLVENKSRFKIYLETAKLYYQENGHLFVPKDYCDPTGVRLGKWIKDIRDSKDMLTENQINALTDVGMVWTEVAKEKWLHNFRMATCNDTIPEDAVTVDNQSLQEWFKEQKELYVNFELSDEYKFEAMEEKFGLPDLSYIEEAVQEEQSKQEIQKQEQTEKENSDKKHKKDKHKRRDYDER